MGIVESKDILLESVKVRRKGLKKRIGLGNVLLYKNGFRYVIIEYEFWDDEYLFSIGDIK